MRSCDFRPARRPRESVVGRMTVAAWEAELTQQYPTVAAKDVDTGAVVELRNVHSATSLGHQFTSNGDTEVDIDSRRHKADAEFYRGLHLWRSTIVTRKHARVEDGRPRATA